LNLGVSVASEMHSSAPSPARLRCRKQRSVLSAQGITNS
jgi:hypothetical protein